ncbi:MAG: hypothetical protein ABI895_24145 [Deltaproteobacteria bacterium]
MTKSFSKLTHGIALTLAASVLFAGAAGAQTFDRAPVLDRDTSSGRLELDRSTLTRPQTGFVDLTVTRPPLMKRPGGAVAWPAVVGAVVAVVAAGVEVVHRVTESWMPGNLQLPGRGELVNIGAYDR